ncbi:uncharacterized protein C13orf42 homolog [Pantherophis guttatus]|uniref:Uncharacterized protein C13orf42 homolog n=1 Tax=Pantherophis guttatus TaxID=94885 RepID=A0A6P9CXB2_PANGU|nr:uncharacterized protein C13orf42 homolog [Pantherophis guttatus]
MFRKIHSIFHPNSSRSSLSDGIPAYDGSAVRLIRSTSMYALRDEDHTLIEPLKKSKSTTSLNSVACLQLKEEKAWMYSKTQDCLQYLQDLLALRKKYLAGVKDLKALGRVPEISPLPAKSSATTTKTQAPPPPKLTSKIPADRNGSQLSSDVTEAIAYFDSIIAKLEAERFHKVVRDHPHVDVDFDIVSSSREHSLHSNWILRAPRRYSQDTSQVEAITSQSKGKGQGGTFSSRKKLQRYPMYLPKAVEGAFNTMKFKPKMCLKEQH